MLELSLREALQLGHNYIGTEHMLLGLVREGEGVAARALMCLGADLSRVRQQVIQLLPGYQNRDTVAAARDTEDDAITGLLGRPWSRATERRNPAVDRRWSAEVVVAGRRPEDFAAAYDQLAGLAGLLGLSDLEAGRLQLDSVESDDGPGLRLSITHELLPEVVEDVPGVLREVDER